jgi:hypothetical protein
VAIAGASFELVNHTFIGQFRARRVEALGPLLPQRLLLDGEK